MLRIGAAMCAINLVPGRVMRQRAMLRTTTANEVSSALTILELCVAANFIMGGRFGPQLHYLGRA